MSVRGEQKSPCIIYTGNFSNTETSFWHAHIHSFPVLIRCALLMIFGLDW